MSLNPDNCSVTCVSEPSAFRTNRFSPPFWMSSRLPSLEHPRRVPVTDEGFLQAIEPATGSGLLRPTDP
jgi:hypothetical protein